MTWFFPSVNASMWVKNTTRRHVEALRADGHTVVEPREQQVYELWQRDFAPGLAMPAPGEATGIIIDWLDSELALRSMEPPRITANRPVTGRRRSRHRIPPGGHMR